MNTKDKDFQELLIKNQQQARIKANQKKLLHFFYLKKKESKLKFEDIKKLGCL